FTNLGGNFAFEIDDVPRSTPVWTRQQKRTRYNVARLIGGYTPGPGNIEFAFSDYHIDENNPVLSVTMDRQDGRLGTIQGDVATSNLVAQSSSDFTFTKTTEAWPESGVTIDPITGLFRAFNAPHSAGFVGLI